MRKAYHRLRGQLARGFKQWALAAMSGGSSKAHAYLRNLGHSDHQARVLAATQGRQLDARVRDERN
eukprot:3168934-Prorocentrum_lima.AAC.1